MNTGSTTLVIGVGNRYRSDDAVGIIVARRLKERNLARITVIEATGEGAALIESWKAAEAVIVVDAVHSGATPGTVHRFDTRAERIPSRFFHYSTHAFGLAEAVELARTLGQLPPLLIVYGVEGKNFAAGEELSAELEKAVLKVVERILNEIQPWTSSH